MENSNVVQNVNECTINKLLHNACACRVLCSVLCASAKAAKEGKKEKTFTMRHVKFSDGEASVVEWSGKLQKHVRRLKLLERVFAKFCKAKVIMTLQ